MKAHNIINAVGALATVLLVTDGGMLIYIANTCPLLDCAR